MFSGNWIKKTTAPALLAGAIFLLTSGCGKNIDNSAVQLPIDRAKIETFLSTHCLTPQGEIEPLPESSPDGLPAGYVLLKDTAWTVGNMKIVHLRHGEGSFPTTKNQVEIRYRGYYLESMQLFDNTEDDQYPYKVWLSGAIKGMQDGLTNMATGIPEGDLRLNPGEAWLIMPSTMAFGNIGKTDPTVPPNTCLIYRVTLYAITGQTP